MSIEVATATVTIVPNMKGSQEKIIDDLNPDKVGDQAGKGLGLKLGTAIKSAFAAAAVGEFIKKSLDAGADLQQSFGGLDTIYEDSAAAMKDYANQAYKMGLSANDYAETAVGMGAALKAAFGGDTEKAMEAANMAIEDMTDNAAKMGSPIESIQNAYAGFAKGQFNMLDNLKLGYGGTKSEMERLLSDAQELTGVEYNIDNLGDVYEAIHVIQGELGLTGVAAEEAETTFSGSFGAMKAAATNLLASLSIGEGVQEAFSGLGQTVQTFLVGNLLPMIGNIVTAVPGVVAQIPGFIADLIPQIIPLAGRIIADFAKALVAAIPQLLAGLARIPLEIVNMFTGIDWGSVGSAIVTQFGSAWESLTGMASNIWGTVTSIFSETISTMPIIGDAWNALSGFASGIWDTVVGVFTGEISVGSIITGAWDAITDTAQRLWDAVVGFFTGGISVEEIDTGAWDIITGLASTLWENVKAIFGGVISVLGIITDAWASIADIAAGFWSDVVGVFTGEISVGELATSAWEGLKGVAETCFNAAKDVFETGVITVKKVVSNAWEGLKGVATKCFNAAKNVFSGSTKVKEVSTAAWDKLSDAASTAFNAAKGVIEGAAPAVKAISTKAWDTLSTTASSIWGDVKDVFGSFDIEWPDFGELASNAFEGLKNAASSAWDWVKGLFGGGKNDETVQAVEGSTAEMEAALKNCNLVVSDVDTSAIDTANTYVETSASGWASTVSGTSLTLPSVNTGTLLSAIGAVQSAASAMRSAMNFSWSIPTPHGSLPVISVSMHSASSSDGKTTASYPVFNVGTRWYAKGGIFEQPTVIGVGEAGAEAALPLDQFWRKLDDEFSSSGSGATINNYIEINGANDPVAYADELARELQQQLKRA